MALYLDRQAFVMRRILWLGFILISFSETFSQLTLTYDVDSLKRILETNLSDTNRIWALDNLGRNIHDSDTTVVLAHQAITLAQKIGFKKGEAEAYNNIGYWFTQKGNYPKAIENYLKAIQLAESANYEEGLKRSFNNIAGVYCFLKNYRTSIDYAAKSSKLSTKFNDLSTLALAYSWQSRSYLELHQTDSALKYAQLSYQAASKSKDYLPLFQATARLGEVNSSLGNHPLALEYLRLSLYNSKRDGRKFRIAGAHQELAETFQNMKSIDSCLWHAQQAFKISREENLAGSLLTSSLLLSALYEGENDSESLRYHKIALVAQDSLFSQEKNRQVEALNFNETIRRQEMEAQKRLAEEERKHNLQYAAIALGLIIFVILFLLLSHTVIANEGLIKFLGLLALLIVFEFINLLLDPFVGNLTQDSPFLMLASMVCIAALLIPVHHYLEKWVIERLIEKNKKIRLAAAKKVIATLEGDKNG